MIRAAICTLVKDVDAKHERVWKAISHQTDKIAYVK